MSSKPFLNEALQIGPWRVARKHLLFIIAFSFFVVLFGIVVLQTHIFDGPGEEDDDEDDDDDDDEEDWKAGGTFGSGDWLMVVIMTLSGMLAITAAVVCFFAKKNAPSQLGSSYAAQYNKDTKTPINSIPRPTYTTPQPISLIAGHIVQQIQAQQKAAQSSGEVINTQESHMQQQVQQTQPQTHQVQLQSQQIIVQQRQPPQQVQTPQQIQPAQQSSVHLVQRPVKIDAPQRIQITANPSVPNQITVELPPPYSP